MIIKIFYKNKAQAFTLIEMLVSIGVITLISALFVANYRTGNERTDLSMTSQSLAADLRQAQNNALALVTYGDSLPAGGWGVHLEKDSSSYILFADEQAPPNDGASEYNNGESDINSGARITTLSSGIIIDDLIISENNSVAEVDITFLPPDPQTTIKAVGVGTSTTLRIVLKEIEENTTKTISINVFGLIEVTD